MTPPDGTATTLESPLLTQARGFIAGEWVGADSGESFQVTNPATGELLAELPAMGRAETIRAIEAGERALEQPASLDQRVSWLEQVVAAHLGHKEEIGRILTMENGKPLKEAIGEVEYAAGFYRNCINHAHVLESHTLSDKPKGCTWTVHRRPAGVVGLITPWNFPIGMIAKKLSSALVADCSSVIKPAAQTPLTMVALFALLDKEVGLPPGKVNLVLGPAKPIGDALCEHPAVKVISFTGSTEVGRRLIKNTADSVKRLTLELGGNAPFIVFDDADLDKAADEFMANKFRAGGQTCVCANRIYAHASIAASFGERLAERVNKMKIGNGLDYETDIGPLIDRNGFDKVSRHVQDALQKGAKRVAGTEPDEPAGDDWGCFFPPTVLTGVTEDMVCCREETFGPVAPILEFEDEANVIARSNGTEYGLAAYLFTDDAARAERMIHQLHFGHVGWNTGTGPTPEAPFGGMKQSGYGREGGVEGLFEFTDTQTVPHAG